MTSLEQEGESGEGLQRVHYVQSVTRAIDILRCFLDEPGPHSLTELSLSSGLNLSTTHRLLRTLCASELLSYRPDSERYWIGPMLVRLGQSALRGAGLTEATAILTDLVHETQESASLGVLRGSEVQVVLAIRSDQPLGFDRSVGTRVAMHASAMGKVLMALGTRPVHEVIAQLGPLEQFTPKTLRSAAALERDLRLTVTRGYALSDEERYVGVRTIGLPIFDADGRAFAAVAIQGPIFRLTDQRLDALAGHVKIVAKQLEGVLRPDLLS